jgi:hypothetical protein
LCRLDGPPQRRGIDRDRSGAVELGETDPVDAHSVAVAGLRSPGLRQVQIDDATVALRLLVGRTVVLVGHSETVECSFHALAGQPFHRAFDLTVAPASITEWTCDGEPTGWPPPRWTLRRFNDAR